MVPRQNALIQMLGLVEEIPLPLPRAQARRGRRQAYSPHLFVKAAIIMTTKRLHKVHELLSTLAEPTQAMQSLREHLTLNGKMPSRRTFERRLAQLTQDLPELIARLGALLVERLRPFAEAGRAVAIDSTVLRAKDGAVWHRKHKEAGQIPHTRIDTQAGWTKSGWHGWVYGWKLHLSCTVGSVWIPLTARLTAADVHDGEVGPLLVADLPESVRFALGDQHYNGPSMQSACFQRGMNLVATRGGKYPHTDAGVEVRRMFHQLRSKAIENFNEHFKAIFDSHADVPSKGRNATTRFALSAVLVYQLGLWARHRLGLPLNQGLKAFLKAV